MGLTWATSMLFIYILLYFYWVRPNKELQSPNDKKLFLFGFASSIGAYLSALYELIK